MVPEKYTNPVTRDFYFYKRFIYGLERQGCCYFKPPNVSGWPSYYQAPVFDLFWINSKPYLIELSLAKILNGV